jgi:hypothetical protein
MNSGFSGEERITYLLCANIIKVIVAKKLVIGGKRNLMLRRRMWGLNKRVHTLFWEGEGCKGPERTVPILDSRWR